MAGEIRYPAVALSQEDAPPVDIKAQQEHRPHPPFLTREPKKQLESCLAKYIPELKNGKKRAVPLVEVGIAPSRNGIDFPDDFPSVEFFDFVAEQQKKGIAVTIKPYELTSGTHLHVRFEVVDKAAFDRATADGTQAAESSGSKEKKMEDIAGGLRQLKDAIAAESNNSSRSRKETLDAVAQALEQIVDAADVTAMQKGTPGQETPIISGYSFPPRKAGSAISAFDSVTFHVPLRDPNGNRDARAAEQYLAPTLTKLIPDALQDSVSFEYNQQSQDIRITIQVEPKSIDGISTDVFKKKQIESHAKGEIQSYKDRNKQRLEQKSADMAVTQLTSCRNFGEFQAALAQIDWQKNPHLKWCGLIQNTLNYLRDSTVVLQRPNDILQAVASITASPEHQSQIDFIKSNLYQEVKNTTVRTIFDKNTLYTDDQVSNMGKWLDYMESEAFYALPNGGRIDTFTIARASGVEEKHKIADLCAGYKAVLKNPKKYKKGMDTYPPIVTRCLSFGAISQLTTYVNNSKRFGIF
ncbi:MAG: hypothetical protein GW925_01235 [Candidatus Pacebacteria bacterium]|nr:hypothetical protein [Candidatus Paceibacterota bacterium]